MVEICCFGGGSLRESWGSDPATPPARKASAADAVDAALLSLIRPNDSDTLNLASSMPDARDEDQTLFLQGQSCQSKASGP